VDFREQLAAFRYSLIAPIVSRQTPFLPGEIKATLKEIASRHYTVPGGSRTRISTRSLERYVAEYREHGWEGLKPKPRATSGPKAIPKSILEIAAELRRARPERSVEQIKYILESSNAVSQGSVASSTLARHLRGLGLSRKELLQEPTGRRRFEAPDVHILWQADFQHTLYLPDPSDPKKRRKAILFAVLDDYSRLIVHGEFYWDERLPRLEDALKKAILKHGIPEQLYCDNGAVFSSSHLERICGKLGMRLSHTRPYRPEGRGKIERFFRFIDTSFKHEAYLQIENGRLSTLPELNDAFRSWVDGYYHTREHGGTKMAPIDRAKTERVRRHVSLVELTDIFLWEEERKVDKSSCISLYGNTYEVDPALCTKKVTLRFDPFDLSLVQVWLLGKRFADATVLDLTRKALEKAPTQECAATSDISFFDLTEKQRRLALPPLSYSGKEVSHD
jgi:transposase InsO family protein